MTGKAIVFILLAAIAAVAVVAVMAMPSDNSPDPVDPDDPVVVPLPKGISFDEKTGVLKSKSEVTWYVTDELKEFYKIEKDPETGKDKYIAQRDLEPVIGKSITLAPGLYTVTVGEDTFKVIVDGKIHRVASLDGPYGVDSYYFNGQRHTITIEYDIDVREIAVVTLENRELNKSWKNDPDGYRFTDLTKAVYVNDTIRSIESQMRQKFIEIGGDINNKQSYADFLVSFAQLGVDYPNRGEENRTDYEVWGEASEYWANSLETLLFLKGDCEDSAAVACSILKAAGYDVAMVGVGSRSGGHVTAAVALDSFIETSKEELGKYSRTPGIFKVGSGTSAVETDPSDVVYYGVDTTEGQLPVGYMLGSSVELIGANSPWGICGFYPVPSN